MSDETTEPEGADDDSLAAEYALGLTPAGELDTVAGRVRTDPAFAAAVGMWQERFARLAEEVKPVKPPRKAQRRLKKRLFGGERRPLLKQLWVWQGISFAALGLAAWISLNDLTPDQVPTAPVYAAQIDNDAEGLSVLAVYDPSRGALSLNRIAGEARPGRSLQLWAIAPGSDPVSLGVLPETAASRVLIPEALAGIASELTLAISDEPRGGSPGSLPTGDILGAVPFAGL